MAAFGSDPGPRRRWLALGLRAAALLTRARTRTQQLIRDSYDQIAPGYDRAWTDHMRDLSVAMLDRLAPPPGARCADLTCGTGFVTGELAARTGGDVVGVDASAGMLDVARSAHARSCRFVLSDALTWLKRQPSRSFDVVTCGWGLGYTQPIRVVRQIARVCRVGGQVGIIDNSLFSLAGVLWGSLLTFAEQPAALRHAMKVRFLPHSIVLATIMRAAGLAVTDAWDGHKSYAVPDGRAAIARLTATGAAAGFEFAVDPDRRDAVFDRFAEILEARHSGGPVRITHRYLAAVGRRLR